MNRKAISKMQALIVIAIVIVAVVAVYFAAPYLMMPDERVEIEMTTLLTDPLWRACVSSINNAFMEKYPNIKIIDNPVPLLEYNTMLPVWIGTAAAPDIFSYWGGVKAQSAVDKGYFLDLSDISTSLKNAYAPSVYEGYAEYDNKPYAVPIYRHDHGLWYNKAILSDYGIAAPETWDELIAACETIWTESEGAIYPFGVGAKFPWLPDIQFGNILGKHAGPDFFYGLILGQESWADAKVIQALNYYRQIIDYMPTYIFELDEAGITEELATGKIAMEICGAWRGSSLINAGFPEKDIGWVPVPTINPAYETIKGSAADILVGSSTTSHPNEVKLYLEFWATPEAAEIMTTTTGRMAATKHLTIDYYEENFNKAILSSVEKATGWVTEVGFAIADDALKVQYRTILAEFVKGDITAATAAQRFDALDW